MGDPPHDVTTQAMLNMSLVIVIVGPLGPPSTLVGRLPRNIISWVALLLAFLQCLSKILMHGPRRAETVEICAPIFDAQSSNRPIMIAPNEPNDRTAWVWYGHWHHLRLYAWHRFGTNRPSEHHGHVTCPKAGHNLLQRALSPLPQLASWESENNGIFLFRRCTQPTYLPGTNVRTLGAGAKRPHGGCTILYNTLLYSTIHCFLFQKSAPDQAHKMSLLTRRPRRLTTGPPERRTISVPK